MRIELPLEIERRPDCTTCGPTGPHSVYRFLGDDIPLEHAIEEAPMDHGAGTLDVHGDALGHFIVDCGCDSKMRKASIADPLRGDPAHGTSHDKVGIHRLIGAIFLGATPHDADFLVLTPPKPLRAAAPRP